MVRQFARDEVAPVAAKYDADAKFPWENIRKMGELGLLGVPWPEELGGAGLDLISYMIVIHELAQGRRVARAHDLGAHDARHVADRAASAPTSRSGATCRSSRPARSWAASA